MTNKPLTVTLHIGGNRIDKLTDEQTEKIAQRLSDVMSRYYTAHISEYQKIKIANAKGEAKEKTAGATV